MYLVCGNPVGFSGLTLYSVTWWSLLIIFRRGGGFLLSVNRGFIPPTLSVIRVFGLVTQIKTCGPAPLVRGHHCFIQMAPVSGPECDLVCRGFCRCQFCGSSFLLTLVWPSTVSGCWSLLPSLPQFIGSCSLSSVCWCNQLSSFWKRLCKNWCPFLKCLVEFTNETEKARDSFSRRL